MKFVTILPSKYLPDKRFWTSNTNLILTHLILQDKEYEKACRECDGYKILDNSFYELRENPSVDLLIETAKKVNAHMICLPDTKWSGMFSWAMQAQAMKVKKAGFEVMACVTCSEDFETEMKIFKALNELNEVDMIAIPYVFREGDDMKRWKFLDMIEKEVGIGNIRKRIHLFGCNSVPNLSKENRPWIESIDGTMPFKEGYYNSLLPVIPAKEHKRPKDFFSISKLTKEQEESILYNVTWLRTNLEVDRKTKTILS